ncbi:MAG: 16S rRNA (uracil(1498)-N(3))-methyltransferase [Nitrospinae bacterium]|nr:16S rRNA (uracil(1498)-N(3))-methyltransferase [Nitrospinota bacterium]
MRHFLVAPDRIVDGVVTLDRDDARHVATVLRMRPGDEIVVSADGRRWRCRLSTVTPTGATAETLDEAPLPPPETPVTLVQAVPKGKKMDDIIRMATEIGVDRIVPLILSRCEGRPTPDKIERWQAIALSADKQSRSLRPTVVAASATLDSLIVDAGLKLLLWEGEAPSLPTALANHPAPRQVTLLIGPEGGIADDEYRRLVAQGFLPVSLGPKILRTETAGAAALAALRSHLDR